MAIGRTCTAKRDHTKEEELSFRQEDRLATNTQQQHRIPDWRE